MAYFQRRLLLVSGSVTIVTHHHVRHQVITSSPFTSPKLSLHSTGKPWKNLEEANEEKAIMGEYLVPRAKGKRRSAAAVRGPGRVATMEEVPR